MEQNLNRCFFFLYPPPRRAARDPPSPPLSGHEVTFIGLDPSAEGSQGGQLPVGSVVFIEAMYPVWGFQEEIPTAWNLGKLNGSVPATKRTPFGLTS